MTMKKILLFSALFFSIWGKAQLRLVKDVYGVFQQHSYPRNLFVYNDRLYFAAIGSGYQPFLEHYIYSSDGTSAGTHRLKSGAIDLRVTPGSPIYKVFHNGDMVISAIDYISSGGGFGFKKLYRVNAVDNSINDLVNLTSIYDPNGSTFGDPLSFNNKIYFSPITTNQPNPPFLEMIKVEPYMTDLTQSGTTVLKDIVPYVSGTASSSYPSNFTTLETDFYFRAYSTTAGSEIWKSNGTSGGTALYLDVNAGTAGSNPAEFNILGNQLTFVATHGTIGRELFKTNGIGSLIALKDINTSGDSNPSNIKVIDGNLYFSASNGTAGQEIWKSNGFNLGTFMIKDINPTGDSNPSKFTQLGTDVYFIANDGINGIELWKTNGTAAGTVLVKDINATGNSSPDYLTVYHGKLYFTADNGDGQRELWVTDGTGLGTSKITINTTGGSSVSNLCVYNDELYFAANAGNNLGVELYAYATPAFAKNESILSEENSSLTLSLSPNPTKNSFILTGESKIKSVVIYSLQGQMIKLFEMQNQYPVSDLTKGIYIVKIATNVGVESKTLIIE